eukprot:Gregarina_sp_Poly_1__3499@NODE_2019_length_2845_cov_133_921166_g1304_i0_p2_GENE_NODE_2019_length_2845_cov_133_921166_g1304_i0NODE_2019_length_2845_cov_133_921166_g1304_i0_p2_ORF_typecomplete_len338_score25_14P22_AR_C/PF10548_9/0_15_NODE_2019_length_2845_cov_133_921166_g1304_i018322764
MAVDKSNHHTMSRCKKALHGNLKYLDQLAQINAKFQSLLSSHESELRSTDSSAADILNEGAEIQAPTPINLAKTSDLPIHDDDQPSATKSPDPVWTRMLSEIKQRKMDLVHQCLFIFRPVVIGLADKQMTESRILAMKIEDTFVFPIEGTAKTLDWEALCKRNTCAFDEQCHKLDHKTFREAPLNFLVTIDKSSTSVDFANGVYMYSLLTTSLQRICGLVPFCQFAYKASYSCVLLPTVRTPLVTPCNMNICNNPYKGIFWDSNVANDWLFKESHQMKTCTSTLDSGRPQTLHIFKLHPLDSNGLGGDWL